MSEPRWGYRATSDETPEIEIVTTDNGPIWGRIFGDGVVPDGWHASPATIPPVAADETPETLKPKKGKPS